MSLIPLLLLAKAAEEQQRRTGAHRASTKRNNSKSNYSYDKRDTTVSLETFLEDLLATDPEATKLFLLLKDCKEKIDQEDYQNSLKQVQEICARYDEQATLLFKERKNVEDTGVVFDTSKTIEKFYRSVTTTPGHGFGGYGKYSYNPARYCMGFNGMSLTKEMLENNINQFQIDLDKFNEENPFIDEQLEELTANIKKQKRSLKYSPFNKAKKQSLLSDMLKLEKELKKKIAERTLLEEHSKAFAALTEEQKKAILAYMEQVANCIVIGEELSNAISASIAINHDYYGNNSSEERKVHQRVLERAVEQGDFTMESIEAILEKVYTTTEEHKVGYRYERLSDKTYTVWPTSPESMFAAEYFKKFYQAKNKTKK